MSIDFQPGVKLQWCYQKNITPSNSEIITVRVLKNTSGTKLSGNQARDSTALRKQYGRCIKKFYWYGAMQNFIREIKDVARHECELQSGIRIESSHTHRRSCIHFYEVCSRPCSRTRTCRRGVRSRAVRRAIHARIFLKHDRETGTWVSYACRGNSRWREVANKGRNIGIDGGDELQTQLFARSPFLPLIANLHNTIVEYV